MKGFDRFAINAIVSLMAKSLIVRNLDEELVRRLKVRAARHNRSAEAEHREILRQALFGEPDEAFAELAAGLRALTRGRVHTPSEQLQREGRDER
jgi:plasmid stability protein